MQKAVMCTVTGPEVQSTVRALRSGGISNTEISILAPRAEGLKNADLVPDALHGAQVGAIIGGGLSELASVGSLVITGLGPFVVAGPLATLLLGALGGTLIGGMIAATGDLGRLVGIPRSVAHRFERQLEAGRGLILVHYHNDDHKKRALEVFAEVGALDVETTEVTEKPEGKAAGGASSPSH